MSDPVRNSPPRSWKSLDEMSLTGRRVLTRLDINVPIERGGVADDTRIRRAGDTVSEIVRCGGIPIIMSHLGRPKGRPDECLSLRQLLPTIERTFGIRGQFCTETVGSVAEAATRACRSGEFCLLENLRFNPGETANDAGFSVELSKLGDVYCNDAFSASHRAHASIVGIARLLPACAGRQMERELDALEAALGSPKRPVMAIVGGSKVSTKLRVLGNLISRVDQLVIGGAMANTFLLAEGHETGRSLVERDMVATAREVLELAASEGCKVLLPVDVVVGRELRAGCHAETVASRNCPPDMMILDVGVESVRQVTDRMSNCRTLIWNGPVGAFETPPFDKATTAIAAAAAGRTVSGSLVSVAGGGDTVSALKRSGDADAFTFVSTAGGAFLEWMEGRVLPGIAALEG